MLVSISEELLQRRPPAGARRRAPTEALSALIDWHVNFALDHKALIVVQDRDWSALPLEAREKVRETQRKYVEVWVKAAPGGAARAAPKQARASVHAAFGLLNSTPHSAFLPPEEMRELLTDADGRAGPRSLGSAEATLTAAG